MEHTSYDHFYENLTLGLVKNNAGTTPGVQNVHLEKRAPCERIQISTWEQRHSCVLPQDMKQFYLSTDGFKLTWQYEYAGQSHPVGHMRINSISELKRIGGIKPQEDSDCPSLLDVELCNPKTDSNRPHFSVRSKIFEIDSCQGSGRVCLVYLDKQDMEGDKREKPKIWLLDRSFEWHFLADTFTQYFRIMLVHQGLPQWQFRFTSMGLTQFSEQMMLLIAPHLLQPNKTTSVNEWPSAENGPINQLDPTVFRLARDKTVKKKE
ncbi:hypothetical protein RUM44_001258 [Polyplax serrata]|uniref:Knr4/Smi1-like domain-containing protein n=1 Tax=Polyplax serrata TaxID=468196 RepID=A0ABR1AJK1_POLSC